MTLFFILTFAFFLGVGVAFSLVRACASAMSSVPSRAFSFIPIGVASLITVVPLSVYGVVLSSITYSSRHGITGFSSSLVIFALSAIVLFAFSFFWIRLENYGAADSPTTKDRGSTASSILVTHFEGGEAVVLVGSTAVVAVPNVPLRITDVDEGPEYGLRSARIDPYAPSLSVPASLRGLADIFTDAGRRLSAAAKIGWLPLLAYAAALSLLLSSFRFLAGSTKWPLADFLLCAIALRGVIAYDDFLASALVHRLLATIAGPFPPEYLVPAALTIAGGAVGLCASLFVVAQGRRKANA